MMMTDSTLWWIAAGILVLLELASMTFYLLMLAIGAVAAALAAHAGLDQTGQMIVGAIVGAVAVVAGYYWRKRRPGDPPARAQRSVNLDVGEIIQIEQWNDNGTAAVRYRGAPWTVELRPGFPRNSGPHRVVELVGSRLQVEPV
jgi:membrane protein implicated in regulation of membrane protease activity